MGARQQLNSFYVTVAIIIAAIIGGVTESWTIFLIAVAVLISMMLHSGDIRPDSRNRRRHS